jgi:hypothetical protein
MKKLLHDFDRDLRVRWSEPQGRWRLERRVSHGVVWPPSAIETAASMEDRRAAADGYVLVALLEPCELTERLIPVLRRADIWARGGANAVADEMDRMDVEQKRLMRQVVLDNAEAAARERFRYMNAVRTVPERAAHSAPPGGMSIND